MIESRKAIRYSRKSFERELNIIAERDNNGKLHISRAASRIAHDLRKVSRSPNRRIDLQTITESVRVIMMSADFSKH